MKKIYYYAFALMTCLSFAACSDDEIPVPPIPVLPDSETVAMESLDDYTSLSDWSKRSKWNLANVHDPSVVLADDGYYYMFQTDASYGNAHNDCVGSAPANEGQHGHFFCRRSKDLVSWDFMGPTMYGLPAWIKDKHNEIRKAMGLEESTIDYTKDGADSGFGFWAPCVRKVGNVYRMYYSINMPTVGVENSLMTAASIAPNVIGMMETTTPENFGSWVDKGCVITQFSDQGLNFAGKSIWGGYWKYNAIDPTYIETKEGKHWLVYGSWHSGFAAVEIDPTTGMTKNQPGNCWESANEANYGKRIFTRINGNRWQGSEGPEIIYRNGYYYMFIAYGQLAVSYHTRVVRSENIDGPYKDILGRDFTNGQADGTAYPVVTHPYKFGDNHGWVGISHCAVFDDSNGNYYYVSQQRFPANYEGNAASNAIMLGGVRSILWTEDGWPLVMPERYAAIPQDAITEAELVGKWQNIDLGGCASIDDNKCVMSTSVDFELTADKKVAGNWNAGSTWSFDAAKNILTVNGVQLYLKRELDWEASPRKRTIVYAGLSSDKKHTFWGKKL